MQGFTIPPRTSVNTIGTFSPPFQGVSVPLEFTHLQYMCIDCGYKSDDVKEMTEHQEYQATLHTRFERIRRELGFIGLWPRRLMPRRRLENN